MQEIQLVVKNLGQLIVKVVALHMFAGCVLTSAQKECPHLSRPRSTFTAVIAASVKAKPITI